MDKIAYKFIAVRAEHMKANPWSIPPSRIFCATSTFSIIENDHNYITIMKYANPIMLPGVCGRLFGMDIMIDNTIPHNWAIADGLLRIPIYLD